MLFAWKSSTQASGDRKKGSEQGELFATTVLFCGWQVSTSEQTIPNCSAFSLHDGKNEKIQ